MSPGIDCIRILGIELELAYVGKSFHMQIVSNIFPHKSLHCKLDPVQYQEYEYCLLFVHNTINPVSGLVD